MDIRTQNFLILGASKSGFAVAKHILEAGGECSVLEELNTEKARLAINNLQELGAKCLDKATVEQDLSKFDVLVLSPGVPINHDIAVKAKKIGIRIIGELEFGFLRFVPPIIAVTGTNGKTTTVSLIADILNNANIDNRLVGNVGIPITSELPKLTPNTICITEVSSFQLESVNSFLPHVACILNITPDHLERHYTMENYIFLKKRLLKNLRESEFAVLNFDDQTVKGFFSETKAKVIWVSIHEIVDGAYLNNGNLYYKEQMVISEKELRLKGEHNLYDVLFSIACACIMGVKVVDIREALKNFKGVKHRIELIRTKNGVEYFNDSKATNTASSISAIKTMDKPTVLILGGSEKGEDYIDLFKTIKNCNVKHVVLTGASRYHMLEVAGKMSVENVTLTEDFSCAVKIANMFAENGDCVLLSPACASFDCFNGYEERGDKFIKLVGEL